MAEPTSYTPPPSDDAGVAGEAAGALTNPGVYQDDGHIFVCVRVRNVPQNPCLNPSTSSSTGFGAGASQVRKTTTIKEAQKICVSTLENIVIMHDPKSLDDASLMARDSNNVVQLLTERANTGGGEGASARPSQRKSSVVTRTRSSTATGRKGANANRQLVSTQTANYYECDECINSMEAASMLKMPVIKSSDFLQPPAYGSQEDVYRATAMHAVSAAVEGINSCVFAYGQTGSGKTYTLFGDTTNMRRDPGIVPRTLDDLFSQLNDIKASYGANADTDYSYSVSLSFFEIYHNEVFCLFSRQGPLHVQFMRDPSGKKETMIISDLQQQSVTSSEKAYPLVEMGLRRRQTGETGMNARSSRSHAILQVRVTQWRTHRETRETMELNATINLVDLAGSERQRTANTQGKSREDGIQINQSLATLARVINDIANGAKFVNYRDSLLTMVLKDNLGGNSRTFMIATVSPIAFSYQESCATLTYAKDVRRIRNRPVVNRTFQTKASLLEQNARLKTENEKLKEQMEEWMRRWNRNSRGLSVGSNNSGAMVSPDGTPGKPFNRSGGGLGGVVPPSAMRRGDGTLGDGGDAEGGVIAGNTEALLAATDETGLTAPLVISSHRKYTNIAGIGGACVEGGVIRVTSLVGETARLHLADILRQSRQLDEGEDGGDDTGDAENTAAAGKDATPPDQRLTTATSVVVNSAVESENESENDYDVAEVSALSGGTAGAQRVKAPRSTLGGGGIPEDLGYVEFERVGLRTCDHRFYVRFIVPQEESVARAIVDVQLNGKSIGNDNPRELHHGDVVCAYLEDVEGGGQQNLIAFHYVDLNCLSRTSASVNHATLGQIAVSIDLPSEMEGLTIDDIQQLQRDRDKLLDLVQQQQQAIELNKNRGLSRGSSANGSPNRLSPETQALLGSGRTRSQLPGDLDNEELLRRAEEHSRSPDRLEDAIDENKQLHRAMANRSATLAELAKRLAELEAGDSPTVPSKHGSDSSEDEEEEDEESPSATPGEDGETQSSPLAVGTAGTGTAFGPGMSRSMTRVSAPSDSDDDDGDREGESGRGKSKSKRDRGADGGEVVSALPILRAEEVEVPVTFKGAFFEGTEGARERYKAAVREAKLNERIAELEALIAELRAQLALQESQLRVSRDDTLEQQMLREQVEAERDALLREVAALRAENAELNRDNEQLEIYLKRAEEALAAALAMNEDELFKRAKYMAEQIRALKALALLWKRRAMKYIAMGYGEGAGDLRLDHIPWDELRYGATANIAKAQLGPRNTDETAQTIDDFEKETALESVLALEAALADLEKENRRLQDLIRQYEKTIQDLQDLIERLKRERDELLKRLQDATTMDDEERRRLQELLDRTNQDLADAEERLRKVQQQLQDAFDQSNANSLMTNKKYEQLLAEQRQKLAEMQAKLDELTAELAAKDEELRSLMRHLENKDVDNADPDDTIRDVELRNRIEDLIHDAMKNYDPPTGYSAFPADFQFSDEMIALIRVCLRILLDRLKIELYVLNKANLHMFGLLVPTVQLRPEAQFHVFIHELRGVASEVAGRSQRIGGKWTLTEADVLSDLVDHRRRRAGNALCGLLIWYDHWDLSPKAEHVSYMELIRNSDRIMQIARLVRQESALNTNATSTLLMPIPSRSGKSESAFIPESSRRRDRTVSESCNILNRMSENSRRSNLASALSEATTSPARGGHSNEDSRPFSRTTTALALSQNIPFSRTSSNAASFANTMSLAAGTVNNAATLSGTSPSRPPRPTGSNAPPRPPHPGDSLSSAMAPSPQRAHQPQQPSAYSRVASAGVLPVTDNDVAFVAGSDVEQASSINRYNYERRLSLSGVLPLEDPLTRTTTSTAALGRTMGSTTKLDSFSRRNSSQFGRSHTTMPSVGGPRAPIPPAPPANSAAAGGEPSSSTALGRSQSSLVKPSDAGAKDKKLPGEGNHSPKPRPPGSALTKTKKPAPREDPYTAPTSFYNPSIMDALMQRNGSETKSPSTNATAGRAKASSKPQLAATGTAKASKPTTAAPKVHASGGGGNSGKRNTKSDGAVAKGGSTPFEPSREAPRSHLDPDAGAATDSSGSGTPVVPYLNLSHVSRN